jgi:Flp pilus assembly protein TadD
MGTPFDFNKKLQKARQSMGTQNGAEALALYAALARRFPQSGLLAEYGRAAAVTGDFDLADQIWQKLRHREPNNAVLLSLIAWEYQNIRLHGKARELYQQAAAVEPRHLETQLALAWFLARTGGVDQARAAVNQCLALAPREEQARYLSAHLDCRENKLAAAESQLRALIAEVPRRPQVCYSCHAELAHILDRTGRFDEAMNQLAEGKQLVRPTAAEEAARKRIDAWHGDVLARIKTLPKDILDTWAGAFPARARTAPVSLAFLSGSARSGTTLLERILDAHPGVAACDEPLAFSSILPSIDITVPAMPPPRLNVLRQRYLKNFLKALGMSGAGKILLEKSPSKTPWLPAFLRAFPEARIIIALRDPRDVMVSLYFQNQSNTNGLAFAQLAEYYVNIMNLWLAVREWKGLVWLETRYEDTVADLRKEGSRVTQFLGLPWHENQSRFYESNREKTVMSTNYTDVTQPVYTRSMGRWRAYEKHLVPVLPALEPYCKMFGYA